VNKSNTYTEKGDGGFDIGIKGLFSFGGHGGGESTNTATFDELNEWLKQHNYDVEVQGEIFVPKSQSFSRLNLGVLDRQETIFTKSVQMQRIEAPGILRVTLGAKSLVESEDIKMLRNRLDKLEPRMEKVEPRTTQLESRVNVIEPKLASAVAQEGQLGTRIEQVSSNLQAVENDVSTAHTGLMARVCRLEKLWNKLPYDVCG